MEQVPVPSGVNLPLLLRKKWEYQISSAKMKTEKSISPTLKSTQVKSELPLSQKRISRLTKAGASSVSNRTFLDEEIQDRISKTTLSIVEIQKQIHRGEETYYEDTYAHGNLFRGWDSFVDSKEVGNTSGASTQQPGSRRVPADSRWFSYSCPSISRNSKANYLTRNFQIGKMYQSSSFFPSSIANAVDKVGSHPASTVKCTSNTGSTTSLVEIKRESIQIDARTGNTKGAQDKSQYTQTKEEPVELMNTKEQSKRTDIENRTEMPPKKQPIKLQTEKKRKEYEKCTSEAMSPPPTLKSCDGSALSSHIVTKEKLPLGDSKAPIESKYLTNEVPQTPSDRKETIPSQKLRNDENRRRTKRIRKASDNS